ncbi:MAG: SagB/ThcOx family dehydrogenase [Chloroflexota bacterium]|nr:SagB/ThcOx family dehydrogenase [Chloroflexota bacterium]
MAERNRETRAALAFHAATKYSAVRDAAGHVEYVMGTPPILESPIWQEDLSIEPLPYKVYTSLAPIGLPTDLPPSTLPALEALARTGAEPNPGTPQPSRTSLARLARLSNGLLNRTQRTRTGRLVQFRTAGGTGARYHLELYFVCGDLPDLAAGVYHYAADDHSLRQLRAGDVRGSVVEASGHEPAVADAPVILLMTSTFWRNAWRYKARAYRHTYWDAGTSLANTLAIAASLGLPTQVVLGFSDTALNALLGVDGEREAVVAVCAIGRGDPAPNPVAELTRIDHPTRPVSRAEVTFADIPRMHAASSLSSSEEAAAWRAHPLHRRLADPLRPPIRLTPLAPDRLPSAPVEDIILARRSTRHYDTRRPISFELFSTVLDRSARGFAADCLAAGAPPLHDSYLIVNAVDGIPPGVYLHRAQESSIEPLAAGDMRAQAAHLAFDQQYAADAHVNSYYLTDLARVLERFGNRGYRLAQLEAALYAGRLHLAAHAVGLGAVGSTSFDDEVVSFFSPRAAGASYMFVTVFGAKRKADSN